MGVGHQDLFEFQAELGEAVLDAAYFVTWIDNDGLTGLFIA